MKQEEDVDYRQVSREEKQHFCVAPGRKPDQSDLVVDGQQIVIDEKGDCRDYNSI
jgi:hypothetical protein